jgi:hypothetical protein
MTAILSVRRGICGELTNSDMARPGHNIDVAVVENRSQMPGHLPSAEACGRLQACVPDCETRASPSVYGEVCCVCAAPSTSTAQASVSSTGLYDGLR